MSYSREIPWDGPRDADVCIIGEAPGKQEMLEGKPFIGPSGGLIQRALDMAGVRRGEVRFGNVYPTRPDTKDGKFWDKKEIATRRLLEAREYVQSNLEGSQHKLIICCGSVALSTLTGYKHIRDSRHNEGWAGALLPKDRFEPLYRLPDCVLSDSVQWGCILHPSAILQTKTRGMTPWLLAHLTRYIAYARGQVGIIPTPCVEQDHIGEMTYNALRGKVLALDTEYHEESYIPYIIGVSSGVDVVYSLPNNQSTVYWLNKLLETCPLLIAHNAQADIKSLNVAGIHVPHSCKVWDTMVVSKLLQPDLPLSLGAVTRLYGLTYPWKYMRGDITEQLLYNALDVNRTYFIYENQKREASVSPLRMQLIDRQMENLLRLHDMSREGMRVDLVKLNHLRKRHERNITRYTRYIKAAIGQSVYANITTSIGNLERQIQSELLQYKTLRTSWLERRPCGHTDSLLRGPKQDCPDCELAYNNIRAARLAKNETTKTLNAEIKRLKGKLDFSPTNPHHISWLLYDAWKLKLPGRRRKTAKGKLKTDEYELEDLITVCTPQQARILRAIVASKQLSKALSTFLGWDQKNNCQSANFPLVRDHLLPDVKMHGTVTGRPSSGGERDTDTDADDVEFGKFNSFNIPKQYREIFIPRDGYVFVGGDYSDLEGRMVCLDSGDVKLAEWYNAGKRVHSERGHIAYPWCPSEKAKQTVAISKGKYQYTVDFMGKKLGHGTHYGMKFKKAAHELRIPEAEALRVYNAIMSVHKHILLWQEYTIAQVFGKSVLNKLTRRREYDIYPKRKLETEFGRIRYYYGKEEDQANEALSQRPQSHGTDVWYTTFARITQPRSSKLVSPWDGRVVTGTYDSFLCEIREDQADEFAKWLKEQAEQLIPELLACPGARLYRPCFPFAIQRGPNYRVVSE